MVEETVGTPRYGALGTQIQITYLGVVVRLEVYGLVAGGFEGWGGCPKSGRAASEPGLHEARSGSNQEAGHDRS
jgi:hypothetical protein